MIADRGLIQLVDDPLAAAEVAVGQADGAEGIAPGQGHLGSAHGGDLKAAAAQVEEGEIGAGRVGRIGPHPDGDEARLDLAGDDGQRHAHGRLDEGGELGAVGAIADGARAEDGHLLGALGAGETDEATDRLRGDELGLAGEGEFAQGGREDPDRLAGASHLGAGGGVDDGDFEGIRPEVDHGEQGHVRKGDRF